MKAVYAAFFRLSSRQEIEIGALGEKTFEPGIYVYVGSAMTNAEKRIQRHFSDKESFHWHIDYFRSKADPLDCFILPESSDYECVLSEITGDIGEPVPDFGASDCECEAHLFRIPELS